MTPHRPIFDHVPAYLRDAITNASAERREAARLACLDPAPTAKERWAQRVILEALDLIEAEEIESRLAGAADESRLLLQALRSRSQRQGGSA